MRIDTIKTLFWLIDVRDAIKSGKLKLNLLETEVLIKEEAYEASKRITLFASDPRGW